MTNTNTTEKPVATVTINAGGWEEMSAVNGDLTFGQTREVLAAVIKQRDELLESLREYVLLETASAPYSDSPMRLKAATAIAKAEGRG